MIVVYVLLGIIGVVALWFLLLFISGLFIDPSKEYDTNSRYYRFLLNFSTAVAIRVCRLRIKTTGMDKVPQGKRFLLVSNHRSNFDPLITWHVFAKYDLAFISKASNFKIPFFGRIILKCCFMPIDRKDSEKANITKERAARLLRNDAVSVAVYPEGTRSKTGVTLPFHNGIFNIAKEGGVPIVIMTLRGTADVKNRYPWHHTDIYLDVLDVIPAEEVAAKTPHELGEKVREEMLKVLGC